VKTASIVIISDIYLRSENCQAKLSRMIDRFHTKWFRLTDIVAHDAFEFARREGIDVIICGHAHEGMKQIFHEGGRTIEYWNSEDWTGLDCSFITIDEKGSTELHFLTNNPFSLNLNVNNSNYYG
jgi:UDP-2,3-diacylglucosamine pyrophosphatase LpxH